MCPTSSAPGMDTASRHAIGMPVPGWFNGSWVPSPQSQTPCPPYVTPAIGDTSSDHARRFRTSAAENGSLLW